MLGTRSAIEAKIDGRMMRAVMHERLSGLAAEVDRTRQERGFRDAVDAMRRFWRYSPLNQWLIALQRPDATRVAAESVWESLGRHVKAGETAIGILAPTRWRRGRGFIDVPVFDISQTHGRRVSHLDALIRGHSRHSVTLQRAAATLGVGVECGKLPDGVAGLSLGRLIRLDARLRGKAKVSVLAHELAHDVLHQRERHRSLTAKRPPPKRPHAERETEAEATAYIVLGVLGIASKAPTYIGWQGGEGRQIFRSMKRIQQAASTILHAEGLGVRAQRTAPADDQPVRGDGPWRAASPIEARTSSGPALA